MVSASGPISHGFRIFSSSNRLRFELYLTIVGRKIGFLGVRVCAICGILVIKSFGESICWFLK